MHIELYKISYRPLISKYLLNCRKHKPALKKRYIYGVTKSHIDFVTLLEFTIGKVRYYKIGVFTLHSLSLSLSPIYYSLILLYYLYTITFLLPCYNIYLRSTCIYNMYTLFSSITFLNHLLLYFFYL